MEMESFVFNAPPKGPGGLIHQQSVDTIWVCISTENHLQVRPPPETFHSPRGETVHSPRLETCFAETYDCSESRNSLGSGDLVMIDSFWKAYI